MFASATHHRDSREIKLTISLGTSHEVFIITQGCQKDLNRRMFFLLFFVVFFLITVVSGRAFLDSKKLKVAGNITSCQHLLTTQNTADKLRKLTTCN